MSLSPLTITGVSSMSSDLQTILTRAVNIAKIPLTRLQNLDTDTLQKKSLLSGMMTPLTDLGHSITALGTIAANQAVAATSSNPAKVSIVSSNASAAGNYVISDITSLAQAASETSAASYADPAATPVSAKGKMRLVLGGTNFDFTLTSNTLNGVRDKINSLGAGVTASVINTGQTNYLLVSAAGTGATTLKLVDDPAGAQTNLLTANNQGSDAAFKLNGIAVTRHGNTVNDLIPGVSFSLLDKTAQGETVNVKIATNRDQLSGAIQTFVDDYNAVTALTNQQVGPGAGLLSGDFLVGQVRTSLRSIGGYQASGAVKSLADMGIEFDSKGKMSFNTAKFSALSDSQIVGALQFCGSATSGFGALAAKFTQIADPIDGAIRQQLDSYDATDHRLQKQVAETTDRINAMQRALASRLQAADTLLAQLESQKTSLTASIQSMNFSLYGKQQGN